MYGEFPDPLGGTGNGIGGKYAHLFPKINDTAILSQCGSHQDLLSFGADSREYLFLQKI
jgi:hypothetical protein